MNSTAVATILETGFNRVAEKDVAAAVQICVRLARLKHDPYSLSYFLALQENAKGESERNFMKEYSGRLDNKTIREVYTQGTERAIQVREMRDDLAKILSMRNPDQKIFFIGSNSVDDEIDSALLSISSLKPPPGMTPVDTAYFYNQSFELMATLNARIQAIRVIKARMLTSCSNYLSQIERQLATDDSVYGVLSSAQDTVTAFLREKCPEGLAQFSIALEGLKQGESERLSTTMTHLRRCLKSIADVVSPPLAGNDALTSDKFLNRLSKFIEDCKNSLGFVSPIDVTSLERLLRDVNDRASKGVHDYVTFFEAQQVVIAAILYIDNIRSACQCVADSKQQA